LKEDLEALEELLKAEKPPKRRVRSTKCLDASATGHATNFQKSDQQGN
jgi:hypothetical protein